MLIGGNRPGRAPGLTALLERRILFFGGKGGVGKTTSASAMALWASRQGRKVLLVSTDPAHSTADIFDCEIGPEEREIAPNLTALEIDPDRESEHYIQTVKENLRQVVSLAFREEVEKHVEMARLAPGAEEAALFDRITTILDTAADRYDLVVFDTAPTGHTLRLLTLPQLMSAWMDGMIRRREKSNELHAVWKGMGGERPADPDDDPVARTLKERRRKLAKAGRLLKDTATTAFVLVLIPEKLPILETAKALQVLEHHGVPVGGMVVNRVLPEEPEGAFLQRRKAQEAEYLAEIRERFGRYRPIYVPMLDRDVRGMESLTRIGDYLSGAAAVSP